MISRVFPRMPAATLAGRLVALAVLVYAMPGAAADSRYDPTHKARFRAADQDDSRGLSRAEVEAALPRVLLRHFDEIDTDADGELSPDELVAMRERESAHREARRQARLDELRGNSR